MHVDMKSFPIAKIAFAVFTLQTLSVHRFTTLTCTFIHSQVAVKSTFAKRIWLKTLFSTSMLSTTK